MEFTKKNAWALVSVLGAAIASTAVVQGCGGDDAAPSDSTTKDAGTTSTQVDAGGGGTTLSCAAPATQCGEKCVDTKNDPANCGTCGTACAAGLTCTNGACALACSGGATKCGDACVDTDLDNGNCGACGKKCAAGEVCSNGSCGLTCAAPLATCGSGDAGAGAGVGVDGGIAQAFCANTKTDSNNCGACGTVCSASQRCIDGACASGCNTGADCTNDHAMCTANKCVVPRDCSDVLAGNPAAQSGLYTIDPDGAGAVAPFQAYCDMVTAGGGWTIVASFAGADGEQGLTADVDVTGNALLFAYSNTSVAKKVALSALETESLFVRNNGSWLKTDKPLFDANLAVAASDASYAVKIQTGSTTNAFAGQAFADGFMGWTNHDILGGGDFGISRSDGTTTCNTTTTNGFDHHSTSYYDLNCNCDRQYLYSYSNNTQDGDASYKINTGLGAWTASASCTSSEGGGQTFYVAMRRAPTAAASCSAIKAANANATDGFYWIDPDGANGPMGAVRAYCDMTTDGGGYTFVSVQGGISTTRFDQANTCQAIGLNIVVPRTLAHATKMTSLYPGYFSTVPGIYRNVDPTGGNPNYSTGAYNGNAADPCAMMSGGNTKCSSDWGYGGNGTWFVRDIPYQEPNGDYTKGCWLGYYGFDADGFIFNDGNCGYPTGTSYVCSDNVK